MGASTTTSSCRAEERPGLFDPRPQGRLRLLLLRNRLSCGVWLPGDEETLADYDIQHVTYHQGMYAQGHVPGAWFGWQGLVDHGFSPVARGGRVTLFSRSGVRSHRAGSRAAP